MLRPRDNGLLSDASYDTFPTRRIDLEDPESLYIEIDDGMVSGTITEQNGVLVAMLDFVAVHQGRNQGKGTYLIETFAREATLRGAQRLDGIFISPIAMRNRIRIFGADKLRTFEGDEHAIGLDPNSPDYANQLIEKASTVAIAVTVDLTDEAVRARLFNRP